MGTKTATLNIASLPASIQINDTAQPGLLARWQWLGGTGDVDCLWLGSDGGAWTCQTGTGLADCTGATVFVRGVRESHIVAKEDELRSRVTDEGGTRILGLVEEDCGEPVSGNPCSACVNDEAFDHYRVTFAGFNDILPDRLFARLNGEWILPRIQDPLICLWQIFDPVELIQWISLRINGSATGPSWMDLRFRYYRPVIPPTQTTGHFRFPSQTGNISGPIDCVNMSDPGQFVCMPTIAGDPFQCTDHPGASVVVTPSGSAGAMIARPSDRLELQLCPSCQRMTLKRYWGCKQDRTMINRCSCGYKRIVEYGYSG